MKNYIEKTASLLAVFSLWFASCECNPLSNQKVAQQEETKRALEKAVLDDEETKRALEKAVLDHDATRFKKILNKPTDIGCRNIGPDLSSTINLILEKGDADILRLFLESSKGKDFMKYTSLEPIHVAALAGNIELLNLYLTQGQDINLRQGIHNRTPFMIAALNGHRNFVQELINKNANINAKDKDDNSALHLASAYGHVDIMKMVIASKKVNINEANKFGETPLRLAASYRQINAINTLLELPGINTKEINVHNQTLLHSALEGHKSIKKQQYIAFQKKEEDGMLLESVKTLIKNHVDLKHEDCDGNTALHIAALKYPEVAKFLIEADPTLANMPNRYGVLPLEKVFLNRYSEMDQEDLLKTLISAMPTDSINHKNTRGESLLFEAAYTCNVTAVDLLLAKGAKAKDNPTILHTLSNENIEEPYSGNSWEEKERKINLKKQKQLTIAEKLIKNGAPIDGINQQGHTPLTTAIGYNRADMVALLLNSNANPNTPPHQSEIPSRNPTPPLDCALSVRRKDAQIETSLVEAGAQLEAHHLKSCIHHCYYDLYAFMLQKSTMDPNTILCPDTRQTAMHIMALGHTQEEEDMDFTTALINKGANIDTQDINGNTPLHLATKKHNKTMIKFLIQKGASVTIKNNDQKTAEEIVENQGYPEIFELFKNKEIQRSTTN